ncbi:hypothetical protein LSAT2_025423, partial [Lamellibrachia satsuma]
DQTEPSVRSSLLTNDETDTIKNVGDYVSMTRMVAPSGEWSCNYHYGCAISYIHLMAQPFGSTTRNHRGVKLIIGNTSARPSPPRVVASGSFIVVSPSSGNARALNGDFHYRHLD